MSQSIRFLGVAVFAWVGVRAVSLGLVPGTQQLAFDTPARAAPLAVAATSFPPIEPVAPPPPPPGQMAYGAYPPGYGAYPPGYGSPYGTYPPQPPYGAYPPQPSYGAYPPRPVYAPYPVYVPVQTAAYRQSAPSQGERVRRQYAEPPPDQYGDNPYFAPVAPLDEWDGIKLSAGSPAPGSRSAGGDPSFTDAPATPGRLDRLSLSTWAMMRSKPAPPGLASGGQLGGSQAGARLLWRFIPRIAASLRVSAPIGSQRGGEAALGVRVQPFMSIPIAFTAERRQSIGQFGGRSAFAVFAEGGLYDRPMPWHSTLDAYLQSGIVGVRSRDWFVDGSATVSRPVWRNFSAGIGVWGGAQPGLNRLDVGPRVSMRVRRSMRVHLDYRYKAVGNADPGSGGVVTLAADF